MDFSNFIIYLTLFFALYFQIFIFLIILDNRKEFKKNKKISRDFLPTVSIIVPCWNEEDTVEGTLKSLLNLDYPKNKLKIIVVDDGSTDKTAERVKKFLPHPQIKLIQKENGGKHTAMNLALKNIDTDLVGSLDADSFVDEKALLYIVPHFKNKKIASVTSSIKILEKNNFWAHLQKAEFLISITMRKIFSQLGSVFITPGPFSIFRTSVVKELGGWRKAHTTEDMEIGVRIQLQNYEIENEEKAIVWTKPLLTFKGIYKQRLRWVYGFLKNAWDYKYIFFNKKYGNLGIFVFPSFIIGLILSIILYFVFWWNIGQDIYDWVEEKRIIGWKFSWPKFDWFYWNTETATFISLILLLTTIAFIFFAKKITKEEKNFTIEIPIYLTFYMLVAPIWLTVALLKATLGIENKWEDN